jgi:uncharacterized protein YndB with AHSA1/START domain
MTILKSKWIVFIMPLVFLSCKAVHTEIVIPAPPDVIWMVLTDAAGYQEWNPVLIPVEGEIREVSKGSDL